MEHRCLAQSKLQIHLYQELQELTLQTLLAQICLGGKFTTAITRFPSNSERL